jgi:hypothetical protein
VPKAVRDAQPQDVSVRVRAVAPLDVAYMQGPRTLWSKGRADSKFSHEPIPVVAVPSPAAP